MNQAALTGIVVCGGKSSRMGKDKSMLQYYDEPQRYHVAALLQAFCSNVYISLNNNQDEVNIDKYKIISDKAMFDNLGPMTALLSVYESLPDKNFLFIGCDYPLLTTRELALFVQSIHESTKAKTFFNDAEHLYEPLLGYYPASFGKTLKDSFLQGNNSMQKLLIRSEAGKYIPVDKNTLRSVDEHAQFEEVKTILRNSNAAEFPYKT